MKPKPILHPLLRSSQRAYPPPYACGSGATGRIGFRNWQQQERERGGFERRRGYRRRVDLLFVI